MENRCVAANNFSVLEHRVFVATFIHRIIIFVIHRIISTIITIIILIILAPSQSSTWRRELMSRLRAPDQQDYEDYCDDYFDEDNLMMMMMMMIKIMSIMKKMRIFCYNNAMSPA